LHCRKFKILYEAAWWKDVAMTSLQCCYVDPVHCCLIKFIAPQGPTNQGMVWALQSHYYFCIWICFV